MSYPECYELTFQAPADPRADTVVVRRTERVGAGGHPVYMDDTGIVRAEISDRGEVRILATGGHQAPRLPVSSRPLTAGPEPTAPGTKEAAKEEVPRRAARA